MDINFITPKTEPSVLPALSFIERIFCMSTVKRQAKEIKMLRRESMDIRDEYMEKLSRVIRGLEESKRKIEAQDELLIRLNVKLLEFANLK